MLESNWGVQHPFCTNGETTAQKEEGSSGVTQEIQHGRGQLDSSQHITWGIPFLSVTGTISFDLTTPFLFFWVFLISQVQFYLKCFTNTVWFNHYPHVKNENSEVYNVILFINRREGIWILVQSLRASPLCHVTLRSLATLGRRCHAIPFYGLGKQEGKWLAQDHITSTWYNQD
jgi:hypothetical protein